MHTSHLEAGRYRLLDQVRDTGRRELWRALDEWTNRPVLLVAVAGASPGEADEAGLDVIVRARLEQQVAAATGVRSDHLNAVTGLSVAAGRAWVVSEGFCARTLLGVLRHGWHCAWGRNPAFPAAPRVLASAMSLGRVQGEATSIAGRRAIGRPNYDADYPQSCTVDLVHRTYTAENGTPRTELLRLSGYAGRQPNPDVACAQATAVAAAVAPKLPPGS